MALTELMTALRDCAEQALKDAGRPAGRVQLSPGPEVIWDECCAGMLYVRVNPVTPGVTQAGCGVTTLRASVYVGVLRCAHTLKDDGNMPTAAEVTGDALVMIQDMETLLTAINCCFRKNGDRPGVTVGIWSPVYQGDCHGGEWQLDVTEGVPCGCTDE